MMQQDFPAEWGLRDAMSRLGQAMRDLDAAIQAASGWSWEVWSVPTDWGVLAFGWQPSRIGGRHDNRDDAEESHYLHSCEHRRDPHSDDYSTIEIRRVR